MVRVYTLFACFCAASLLTQDISALTFDHVVLCSDINNDIGFPSVIIEKVRKLSIFMGSQDAMRDVVNRFSKGEQERRRVSVARSYAFYVICCSLGTR